VSAAEAAPVSAAEANALFASLASAPAVILAISGGPDSTALMALAARWRAARKRGPELIAVTIDHGLRPEAAAEARAVKRQAAQLGLAHRTLRWRGHKPTSGLQEAARAARYGLLIDAARRARASHIVTAHTLDDQAETVLIRMARGSGPTGLCAMMHETLLDGVVLARPLLDLPKVRLIATLAALGLPFADDPSNRDPRFTRARLRGLMPALAEEGIDAWRLALLARRLRRAEATIELTVEAAAAAISDETWSARGPIVLDAEKFSRLPAEVALRLMGRAIAARGDEGPVQLAKLEALCEALAATRGAENPRVRRTLAGALITLAGPQLLIERAPPRSGKAPRGGRTLTTGPYGGHRARKAR
jgi:tRNA(Ile)-lysidine synthase